MQSLWNSKQMKKSAPVIYRAGESAKKKQKSTLIDLILFLINAIIIYYLIKFAEEIRMKNKEDPSPPAWFIKRIGNVNNEDTPYKTTNFASAENFENTYTDFSGLDLVGNDSNNQMNQSDTTNTSIHDDVDFDLPNDNIDNKDDDHVKMDLGSNSSVKPMEQNDTKTTAKPITTIHVDDVNRDDDHVKMDLRSNNSVKPMEQNDTKTTAIPLTTIPVDDVNRDDNINNEDDDLVMMDLDEE